MDTSRNAVCDAQGLSHVLRLETFPATHLHGIFTVTRTIPSLIIHPDIPTLSDLVGWRRSANHPMTLEPAALYGRH